MARKTADTTGSAAHRTAVAVEATATLPEGATCRGAFGFLIRTACTARAYGWQGGQWSPVRAAQVAAAGEDPARFAALAAGPTAVNTLGIPDAIRTTVRGGELAAALAALAEADPARSALLALAEAPRAPAVRAAALAALAQKAPAQDTPAQDTPAQDTRRVDAAIAKARKGKGKGKGGGK